MKKLYIFFTLFIIGSHCFGQMAMGTFRSHLPCRNFYSVAVTPDYVYAAGQKHLMLINKDDDNSVSSWSKVDGLSEVGITTIEYASEAELLIVAYNNSNLDFIDKDGNLTNINDIKNKTISGSKQINHIYIEGEQAYFSTGFGIVVINLEKFIIEDTWFTILNDETYSVNALTIFNNNFYITTPIGLFTISKSNNRIGDFNEWTHIDDLGNAEFSHIHTFKDKIITCKYNHLETSDSLYLFENGVWRYAPEFFAQFVRSIDVLDNELLICDWELMHIYDENLVEKDSRRWSHWESLAQGREALFDGPNIIWVADQYQGLSYVNRNEHFYYLFSDSGPANEQVGNIACSEDITIVAPYALSNYAPSYNAPTISFFKDEKWGYYHTEFESFDMAYGLNNVVINPLNKKEFYVASWMNGLLKVSDGTITQQYTPANSLLESNNGFTLISGLAFDKNNNLWITNSKISNLLKVLKKDGTWGSFSLSPVEFGGDASVAEKIIIDSRNYKWITIPRSSTSSKLVVFSDNGTIDNSSDDQIKAIDLNSAANIQTSDINCIAEDKNGYIWIGTNMGIKIIYNASSVFSNNVTYAKNIYITQDGYTQNLLEFETVRCIAVDGANRKWIGTSKAGIFLISADGTEELLHFTAENSPLFSNQINAINISPYTGEVFIGTSEGIISYKGNATQGKENFKEVTVYPNPVKPDYSGYITVTGLMENSFCKITDAAGMLIWQGYANGGTLTWNGKDFYGNRPSTGVYFVFSSNDTGKKKNVAKILFIN